MRHSISQATRHGISFVGTIKRPGETQPKAALLDFFEENGIEANAGDLYFVSWRDQDKDIITRAFEVESQIIISPAKLLT